MGKIELRDFDGDLTALPAMAYDTLFEEYGDDTWRDLNLPGIARHLFADVPDPRFLIGAYDGTRLVAFIANLPRTYRFNGRTYRGVIPTMMAAHKDYRGAVVYLISECLRRNAEFGADFALFTIEKGNRSWRLLETTLKPRYRIERLKPMYAIAHAVNLEKIVESQHLKWYEVAGIKLFGGDCPITASAVSGTVRHYKDADLDQILSLTQCYSDKNCLVRVFKPESLARRLHTEGITSTLVYERGGAIAGFINFTVHEHVSRRGRYRWAWIDFLYWEGCTAKEQSALLAGLWQASREQGCIGILEWDKNYYAKGALFRSRFIPYPHFIEMSAWIFNPALSLQGVDRIAEEII
jgi:GNAT superfamily N-acetyltransferase